MPDNVNTENNHPQQFTGAQGAAAAPAATGPAAAATTAAGPAAAATSAAGAAGAGTPAAAPAAAAPAAAAPAANDSAPPPPGQPSELAIRLAELQAKNQELSDQYLRSQAEMQNTRRRAEEEVAKARKFALESFAESLLPVCDSLEAGLVHQDLTVEQIRQGAEATLRQLKAALERNKVVEINPATGARFDPHQHQAISVVPAEQEPNTVVTVLQKGYSIAERILRPALVTVTAPR